MHPSGNAFLTLRNVWFEALNSLQKGSFNQLSVVTSVEQIDTGMVYLPTLLNQQNHMIIIHVLYICFVLSVKHGQLYHQ